MKFWLLSAALLFTSLAHAKTVELKGPDAEIFLTQHFPNASLPGTVKGTFDYTDKSGAVKKGYAECTFPDMGDRSDGAVTTCTLIY